MKQRLVVIFVALLAASGLGFGLQNAVKAQQSEQADPYPDCVPGFNMNLEASDSNPEVLEWVTFTATLTNETGLTQEHLQFVVGFGQAVWIVGSADFLEPGETITGTTQMRGGLTGPMFNETGVILFDAEGEVLCITRGQGVDIFVGHRNFLPLISKS
ncbi:MAG: hypothetical protein QY318_01635 [Candidatus Dojkabacteria bacterium]|nr:MAG: hypothetical protein QY318_01635 [Candidatus Dojkabacteria bacterium]